MILYLHFADIVMIVVSWFRFVCDEQKCKHTIHFFIFSQKTLNSWNSSIPVLSTWFVVKGNIKAQNQHGEDRKQSSHHMHAHAHTSASKDTSIRLMMLWQVLRVRPSNWISFPEGQTHLKRRETQRPADLVVLKGTEDARLLTMRKPQHGCSVCRRRRTHVC